MISGIGQFIPHRSGEEGISFWDHDFDCIAIFSWAMFKFILTHDSLLIKMAEHREVGVSGYDINFYHQGHDFFRSS